LFDLIDCWQALVSPDKISKNQETVRGLFERSEFRSTLIFWKIGRKYETIRLPILSPTFLLKKGRCPPGTRAKRYKKRKV